MPTEHQQDESALINEILKAGVFAVLGVSRDPEKYGSLVYHDLKRAGKTVYPVNPRADRIDDAPCFALLSALPELPEVAVFVVPPAVSEASVDECAALGITKIWMQEGAELDEAIQRCERHGIQVVHGGPCIMVSLRTQGYLRTR